MLPDIPIRINNLMKAMEKVITPAIDPENSLAQEQATLMVGHLRLLAEQWDKAYLFEKGSFEQMRVLAESLIEIAEGRLNTNAALRELKAVIETVPAELPHTATGINAYTIEIGNCIDELIYACFEEGSEELQDILSEVMLTYGEASTMRDRIWFQGSGLDPESVLPSIDDMLAGEEQEEKC